MRSLTGRTAPPDGDAGYRRLSQAERGHYRGVVRRCRGLRCWLIGHRRQRIRRDDLNGWNVVGFTCRCRGKHAAADHVPARRRGPRSGEWPGCRRSGRARLGVTDWIRSLTGCTNATDCPLRHRRPKWSTASHRERCTISADSPSKQHAARSIGRELTMSGSHGLSQAR
jgi:hypothetical protein